MKERIWEVTYSFDGRRHWAHDVGCVCNDPLAKQFKHLPKWHPHYHEDGSIKRKPDRVVRQPCDPLFKGG